MCGIYFSIARGPPTPPSEELERWLRARGPDSFQMVETRLKTSQGFLDILAVATVLSMRGENVPPQPLVYEHAPEEDARAGRSILCWNGEAWSIGDARITGNDSSIVFERLLDACRRDAAAFNPSQTLNVDGVLRNLVGPFAFVFFDGRLGRLFYSRDCLGRRSLLIHESPRHLTLSSLSDPVTRGWHEVKVDDDSADGNDSARALSLGLEGVQIVCTRATRHSFTLSKTIPIPSTPRLTESTVSVYQLGQQLSLSIATRVISLKPPLTLDTTVPPRVAILFSGGLDCSVLARIIHEYLPVNEPVDLLNVAFENPRIHKASSDRAVECYETCPDRITGHLAVAELREVCSERTWNFVEIDIPFTETEAHQQTVTDLMHPHDTEMDLSIAFALYFASRGAGVIRSPPSSSSPPARTPYTTPARVLFSGLGADELFGGYQRHATAFARGGHAALIDELALDVARLGTRNLGRDDRVLSHWAREPRFPYLDEALVAWAVQLPVAAKTGFGLPAPPAADPPLDDSKLLLRLLARSLGLPRAAAEKKRAIQFGARSAKMHSGRSRGTDRLAR